MLWPEDTKLYIGWVGGHICCGLKILNFILAGLEDIFGTRNKDVLKPQLRVKKTSPACIVGLLSGASSRLTQPAHSECCIVGLLSGASSRLNQPTHSECCIVGLLCGASIRLGQPAHSECCIVGILVFPKMVTTVMICMNVFTHRSHYS